MSHLPCGQMPQRRKIMRRSARPVLRATTAMVNMLFASIAHAAARSSGVRARHINRRGRSMKVLSILFLRCGRHCPGVRHYSNRSRKRTQLTSHLHGCELGYLRLKTACQWLLNRLWSTTVVSTSFSAIVSASSGAHILHVKCWGQRS